MPTNRPRLEIIRELPTIRKLVKELQAKFPPVTPSDRIYGYYDPSYGVWHITCCSWFIYESKKFKNWIKIMRTKYGQVRMTFVMRYIVSSDREKLNATNHKDFFFVE